LALAISISAICGVRKVPDQVARFQRFAQLDALVQRLVAPPAAPTRQILYWPSRERSDENTRPLPSG